MIAQKAQVAKLILGHYSSRYKDITLFKEEAQTVFENVALAEPGKVFNVVNKNKRRATTRATKLILLGTQ